MTEIIYKNINWLRKQIESGVEGYLQTNAERISEAVAEAVAVQMLQAAIADPDADTERLSIVIELPKPDLRGEAFMDPSDWLRSKEQ